MTSCSFTTAVAAILLTSTVRGDNAVSGWVGITFDGKNTVAINELSASAGIVQQFSTIPLGAGEQPNVDAFRCVPFGVNCFFPTESTSGAFLYNLTTSGQLLQKVSLGPVKAHNIHARKDGGAAVLLVLDEAAGQTYIVQVQSNVPSAPIVNLTEYVPAGWTVTPGSTTQCSNNENMWVAVSNTKGGNGVLVQANILTGSVTHVVNLQFPGFISLWADCNDQTGVDTLGGTVLQVSAAGRALVYGTVSQQGAFVPGPTAALPANSPPLAPSGLLTMPDGYDLVAALYPEGATSGAGYLAFADFDGSNWDVQPIPYYLMGAGRWK